jgi:hypothetical protein
MDAWNWAHSPDSDEAPEENPEENPDISQNASE